MNNAFGMNIGIARAFKSSYSLAIEGGFGSYGSRTSRQSYQFDDDTINEIDVNLSNEIYNLQLAGKYFFRNNKNNPYFSGKLGFAWFNTTLTIEDPEDDTVVTLWSLKFFKRSYLHCQRWRWCPYRFQNILSKRKSSPLLF